MRRQRSSDGPMPYGPSGHSGPGSTPEPPPATPPDSGPSGSPPPWSAPGVEEPPTAPPPSAPPPPPPGSAQPGFGTGVPDAGSGQGFGAGPLPGYGAPPPIAQWAPPPGAYGAQVPGAPGLQYGRTLDRTMAWLLDSFIIGLPTFFLTLIILGGAAAGGLLRLSGPALVASVISVGANLLYFVAFWTGSARATPGMRLMKLQMGDAETGAVPTVQQGLIRWFSLGGAISLAAMIPVLATLAGFAALVWEVTLLWTTATSPTKQGLHDRIARTALVQPAGAQTPAQTCLVIMIGLFVLWVVGIIALIAIGGQISTILSSVGNSI